MDITAFKATSDNEKKNLEEKLNSLELEKVQSLWYFVYSRDMVVMGSSKP